MHVHILGIAGTFMGGVAALAKAAGHRVTGSDLNVYPPMSTQLEALGIGLTEGWDPAQLNPTPDIVIVGNVISRGNPVLEEVLDQGLAYTSGPAWLADYVLKDRWVLAVAGTHGKTTTSSLLAYLLDQAGLNPGFLIGGIAADFGVSARLGGAPFFVVEADEYDTAFFDKRAKFVHYHPRTAVLNNLEFDHADIYPDIASIRRQFHHLIRTIPGSGEIIVNGADPELARTLQEGCWTPVVRFGRDGRQPFSARAVREDWSAFEIFQGETVVGHVKWNLLGAHNAENALAAILAARHAGVGVDFAAEVLSRFRGVRRRLEVRGEVRGIIVYDDFAHHPTAVATTLAGLRARVGTQRILAVLEPRSNTMKLGVHNETLGGSLAAADRVYLYQPPSLGWDVSAICTSIGDRAMVATSLEELIGLLVQEARATDHVLIMSNGGFGGLHERLLGALAGGHYVDA